MKFLITALIVYFVYRHFIAPPILNEGGNKQHTENKDKHGNYDGEYIDYEEVD